LRGGCFMEKRAAPPQGKFLSLARLLAAKENGRFKRQK